MLACHRGHVVPWAHLAARESVEWVSGGLGMCSFKLGVDVCVCLCVLTLNRRKEWIGGI
jgi:hypothetical protein